LNSEAEELLQQQKAATAALAKVDLMEDEKLCIACKERPRNCIYESCGHISMCMQCSEKWDKDCPECRVKVSGKRRKVYI